MQFRGFIGASVLSVATLIGFGAASAADLPPRATTKAAVVAPVMTYNWTGCYIGGNVGGGSAHTRQEFALNPFTGILFSDSRGSEVVGGGRSGATINSIDSCWVFKASSISDELTAARLSRCSRPSPLRPRPSKSLPQPPASATS